MKKVIFLSIIFLYIASCTPKRDYWMFYKRHNGSNKDSIFNDVVVNNIPKHIISEGDVLSITTNGDNFSLGSSNALGRDAQKESSTSGVSSFEVSSEGFISLPLAGKIKVSGMLAEDLEDSLYSRYKQFLINPFVRVTISSFRITIMGEVRIAGMRRVDGDHISIIEAIAIGGDITNDAKRTNVKVLRRTKDNKIKMINLDVSSVDVFSSEGYFLNSNDVIYVSQVNSKRFLSSTQQLFFLTNLLNFFITLTFTLGILKK